MYTCPVCNTKLNNTPYYKTKEGKVCEDCYEAPKNTKSDYTKYVENKELTK